MHRIRPTLLVLLLAACSSRAAGPPAPQVPPLPHRAQTKPPEVPPLPSSPAPGLWLHAVDVGQGDALLLLVGQGEGRKVVLIDGGPPDGADGLLSTLRRHDVRAIDLLIISHAHLDHIGGLLRVLEEIPVREVLDSGVPHTTVTYRRLLTHLVKLRESGRLRYHLARRGQRHTLGPHAHLEVLAPEEPLVAGSRSDVNANSVVVRVVHGRVAMLFLGDAERETEERLLRSGANLRADLLKVAHHGSRYASTAELLARVAPRLAIISCGRQNDYRHPHAPTLERLMAVGARIFRTDRDGTVSFWTDGTRIEPMRATEAIVPQARAPPFVASRRGRVFHAPSCVAVTWIRPENALTFATREDAERAGLSPHRCVGEGLR